MPFAATYSKQCHRPGSLRDTRAFALLSHYIWVFQDPLKVEHVDLDKLENELSCSLIELEEIEQPHILLQAIKRSLRILTGNRSMDDSKMDGYIARAWERYMEPCGRMLPSSFSELGLFGLGAGDRTRIALDTCELVFCRPDNLRSIGSVAQSLAQDPVKWRTEPLGVDNLGRRYYLLCETRLYRETPKHIADLILGKAEKKDPPAEEQKVPEQASSSDDSTDASKRRRSTRLVAAAKAASKKQAARQSHAAGAFSTEKLLSAEDIEFADPPQHRMREDDGDLWELVCCSASEWSEFPKAFCRSRGKNERALHRALTEMAPLIVQRLNAAQRQRQRQEAVSHRKRSSRIALRRLLHEEAEAEMEAHNGHYGKSYSSDYSSMDGDYMSGVRRSKRLRSVRSESMVDGDAGQPSGRQLVESRDVRAQRREEARRAALDSADAASAVRKVANVATATGSAQQSDSYQAGPEKEDGREDDDWMFSCSCGKTGHNYDDGRAMTACEKCGIWRHLGCALRAEVQRTGREIDEDDWESVHYVCPNCRRATSAGQADALVTSTSEPAASKDADAVLPRASFERVQGNA